MPTSELASPHRRRLRDIYRSAGWPCQDGIEIELLGAGLVERVRGPLGHETLRVTDAGIALLAETLARNRARRGPHELLVERVEARPTGGSVDLAQAAPVQRGDRRGRGGRGGHDSQA